MDAGQHPRIAEIVQILADRLGGHRKPRRQFIDQHPAVRFRQRNDFILTRCEQHFTLPPLSIFSFY
ncbi:hypothetical protein D3C78_1248500 [compost metagenome]